MDAPTICVDGVARSRLINPRLRSAIGFAEVGAEAVRAQIEDDRATVTALVRHDFVGERDRCARLVGDLIELLEARGAAVEKPTLTSRSRRGRWPAFEIGRRPHVARSIGRKLTSRPRSGPSPTRRRDPPSRSPEFSIAELDGPRNAD